MTAAVLRLLRGEDLDLVSRSLSVTAATLTKWRRPRRRPEQFRQEQLLSVAAAAYCSNQ
jgi:hypothetical protein